MSGNLAGVDFQPNHLYPKSKFKAKVGWGERAWQEAIRRGLKVYRQGNKAYIPGQLAIEFFEREAKAKGGEQ